MSGAWIPFTWRLDGRGGSCRFGRTWHAQVDSPKLRERRGAGDAGDLVRREDARSNARLRLWYRRTKLRHTGYWRTHDMS